jgi:hypothetical protein
MYTCPVCYFARMVDPPKDYNICVCCGTEFGNDDESRTHAQLRQHWISSGAKWFFRESPPLWNPWKQLADANVPLPYTTVVTLGSSFAATVGIQGQIPLAVPNVIIPYTTVTWGDALATTGMIFGQVASLENLGSGTAVTTPEPVAVAKAA